jgi:hypothetical protein
MPMPSARRKKPPPQGEDESRASGKKAAVKPEKKGRAKMAVSC